jgi:predicted nicotinamide N-methyase
MSSCPCSAARSRCFAAASTSGRRPPPPALARTLPHLQRSRRHHPPLVAGAALPPSRSAAEVIAGVDLEAPGWSGGYGTGGKVWNSARVLCDWLADEAEPLGVRGAAVLELGAGTGLVGVVAAKLGAARVLLTDGGSESLLRLAKDNARRNVDPSSAVVRVCAYGWGPGPPPRAVADAAPFDLVLGSDCTYARAAHGALCDAIATAIDASLAAGAERPPEVFLGHQHRVLAALLGGRRGDAWGVDPNLAAFAETAETRGLRVEEVDVRDLAWHGLRRISILRVRRAAKESEASRR